MCWALFLQPYYWDYSVVLFLMMICFEGAGLQKVGRVGCVWLLFIRATTRSGENVFQHDSELNHNIL